ncbi:MAG: Rrf2 family transcriptional regulator [Deltaproteobacteria bacterium]|nr:Rrf2 family transcriptional regulator [Deltaproteobacteria bacterium]
MMAVLARQWPEGRLRSKDLSEEANVPPSYTSKVMRKLVVGGLVDSLRGHHGGFRLTRAPDTIALIEILDAAEFEVAPNECAFGVGRCNPQNPCALHPAWSNLKSCFDGWARTTYLSATTPQELPRESPAP